MRFSQAPHPRLWEPHTTVAQPPILCPQPRSPVPLQSPARRAHRSKGNSNESVLFWINGDWQPPPLPRLAETSSLLSSWLSNSCQRVLDKNPLVCGQHFQSPSQRSSFHSSSLPATPSGIFYFTELNATVLLSYVGSLPSESSQHAEPKAAPQKQSTVPSPLDKCDSDLSQMS